MQREVGVTGDKYYGYVWHQQVSTNFFWRPGSGFVKTVEQTGRQRTRWGGWELSYHTATAGLPNSMTALAFLLQQVPIKLVWLIFSSIPSCTSFHILTFLKVQLTIDVHIYFCVFLPERCYHTSDVAYKWSVLESWKCGNKSPVGRVTLV